MSDTKEKKGGLLDQQVALSAYLGALLGTPETQSAEEPPPGQPVMETPAAAKAELVAPVVTAPAVAKAPPVVEAPPEPAPPVVKTPVIAPPQEEVQPRPAEVKAAPPKTPDNGRPDWAQDEFQSLLFQVAGLTLAVPLAKLSGVTPWQIDLMTPMPGHSALFLGLYSHLECKVKVVDTAQVVLPPHHLAQLGPVGERVSHVVLIGENGWGLACSGIGEVISLGPEDVKWRTALGKRPWLAGTVIQHMCALVDVDSLILLLQKGISET